MTGAEELIKALEWYQEKAESVNRYMSEKNTETQLVAVMTELSLDAGIRAKTAIENQFHQPL